MLININALNSIAINSIAPGKVYRCSQTVTNKKGKKHICRNKKRGSKFCHLHKDKLNHVVNNHNQPKDAHQLSELLNKMVNIYHIDKASLINILTLMVCVIR